MRGLVRHHPLMRSLPKPLIVAVSTASVGLNLLMFEGLEHASVLGVDRYGFFELTILLGGLFLLFLNETGKRGTAWARSLPLEAQVLWTAHVRALVLAVSLMVLAMAAVVFGLTRLIDHAIAFSHLTPGVALVLFARPWLVLLAVALLVGSWRSELADPERADGWNRWRGTVALTALVVQAALHQFPLPVALMPVLAAAVWSRRQCNALPPVLSPAERPDSASGNDHLATAANGRRVLHWIIVRQLFKWPLTWIVGLPMVFLLGMVQGGAFSASVDAEFARYFNVWIAIYLMVAFVGHFLENLHRVDHLPVSRGLILRWFLVPVIAAMVLGGVTGALIDRGRAPTESLVFENDAERPDYGLQVPMDAWLTVWGDPPETVEAPWGEVRRVSRVTIIEGLPLHIWKPYTTWPAASIEFAAWQISRAAAAVHGAEVDPQVIQDRYLEVGPDGAVQVVEGGLTLLSDGLVRVREPVGPLLGLLMGTTVVLALVTSWLVFRACGRGANLRRVRVAFWTAMGVLMALHMGGYALLMTRTVRDWEISGLIGGMASRLGSYGPAGWLGTWLAALVLAVLAWRLCSRAFAKVEAVRGGSTCQL